MPPTSLRLIAALLLWLGLVGAVAPAAGAQDEPPLWALEPAANSFGDGRQEFRYTINPGNQVEDAVVVANLGDAAVHLTLQTAGGVAAWVSPERGDVTVKSGEAVEVPFTVTLPDDTAPGDYVGEIVASDEAGERAGAEVRLRVGGPLNPKLTVEDVQVRYGDGQATVTYTVRNTGNAILSGAQAVSVTGPFGRWKADTGRVDDTPALLPGEAWNASVPVDGAVPALRLTATVTLVPLLTDAAGSTAPLAELQATGAGWVVPWPLLITVAVLCVLAGLAVRVRRRSRRLSAHSGRDHSP